MSGTLFNTTCRSSCSAPETLKQQFYTLTLNSGRPNLLKPRTGPLRKDGHKHQQSQSLPTASQLIGFRGSRGFRVQWVESLTLGVRGLYQVTISKPHAHWVGQNVVHQQDQTANNSCHMFFFESKPAAAEVSESPDRWLNEVWELER